MKNIDRSYVGHDTFPFHFGALCEIAGAGVTTSEEDIAPLEQDAYMLL